MKTIPKMLAFGLVEPVTFGSILFLAAGTFELLASMGFSGGVCRFGVDPQHLPAANESGCASAAYAWRADGGDPSGAKGRYGQRMVVAGSDVHGQRP